MLWLIGGFAAGSALGWYLGARWGLGRIGIEASPITILRENY